MITERQEYSPYVVSTDTYGLLSRWAKRTGYTVPYYTYFLDMTNDLACVLNHYFPHAAEVVRETELRHEITKLVETESKYPVISLDRVYIDKLESANKITGFIDVTRVVDENFVDIDDLCPRPGSLPLEIQKALLWRANEEPVSVVDDVLFSGGGLVRLAKILKGINRPIRQAFFGVGIGKGIEVVQKAGIDVKCAFEYDNVIDEVCERDFFACTPMSGRTVVDKNGEVWSAPYFAPFGDPQDWASIPAGYVEDFSEFCLYQSIYLWKKIEDLSGRNIPVAYSPRKIKYLKETGSISKSLEEYRKSYFEEGDFDLTTSVQSLINKR